MVPLMLKALPPLHANGLSYARHSNGMFPLPLNRPARNPQPKTPKQWHIVLLATAARAAGSHLIMVRPNHTE